MYLFLGGVDGVTIIIIFHLHLFFILRCHKVGVLLHRFEVALLVIIPVYVTPLTPGRKGVTPLTPERKGVTPLTPGRKGVIPLTPGRKGVTPLTPVYTS